MFLFVSAVLGAVLENGVTLIALLALYKQRMT